MSCFRCVRLRHSASFGLRHFSGVVGIRYIYIYYHTYIYAVFILHADAKACQGVHHWGWSMKFSVHDILCDRWCEYTSAPLSVCSVSLMTLSCSDRSPTSLAMWLCSVLLYTAVGSRCIFRCPLVAWSHYNIHAVVWYRSSVCPVHPDWMLPHSSWFWDARLWASCMVIALFILGVPKRS